MLLRKLVIVFCPLLLCLLLGILFQWLDGLNWIRNFFLSALKGLLIGVCLGLFLPLGGITVKSSGLHHWLCGAAGVLFLLLTCQYLQTAGVVQWPVLQSLIPITGQVVVAESAATGFLLLTGLLSGGRRMNR